MKNIIIDSSSAILLYRCDVISSLLKYCNPVVPETVFAELSVPGYSGAGLFEEFFRTGTIKVYEPKEKINSEFPCSLHAGERDAIALFYEGKGDFIIIDDGKGGAFCRDNKIPYINALLAVKILFLKELITETQYSDACRWLNENGRYSEKVKVWAEKADKEMLAFFLQ